MTLNPFIVSVLAMLLRYGIVAGAGALGLDAVLRDSGVDLTKLSTSAAVVLGTVAYAVYKKFGEKQVLVTALASDQPMSEAKAKAMVANPDVATPSVTTAKTEVPVPKDE